MRMSLGSSHPASKLPQRTERPRTFKCQTEVDGDEEKPKKFGRPIGSIAARAQAWEKCPGYLTIGSVRYGVRYSSTTPTREVAPCRGAAGKLGADGDCCCGVVHLAWPRVGAPPSRIPLPPSSPTRANNTLEASVYPSTLEVSHPSTVGYGVMKGAPPTPTSLRRRILDKFGNSSSVPDGETSRLLSTAESREDLPSASAVSQVQTTLDKLHKFRFGGASASDSKKKRNGDKTEKLRELTDLLRGRPDRKKPPTSPPGKTSKTSGLRSLFGSTTSLTGPPKESSSKSGHKRAASVTSVSAGDNNHVSSARKAAQAFTEASHANTLPEEDVTSDGDAKVDELGDQRPFTTRSASFSQVDYNSSDGKYSWKLGPRIRADPTGAKAMTFPRKTHADASTSVSPPLERSIEGQTGSTPSVDSAVGSDEGLALGPGSHLISLDGHKGGGGRSLTYPLTSKKGVLSESIQYSSIDGNGLSNLQMSRELTDVTEEAPSDVMTSPVSNASDQVLNNNSVVDGNKIDATDAQTSHNQEMLLPLENLGREIDELLVQQKCGPNNKPEIFVTTWPKSETDVEKKNRKSLTLNCQIPVLETQESNSTDYNSLDTESIDHPSESCTTNPQRWSGGTDSSSHSAKEGEPTSPEEYNAQPVWPKSKHRLVCQSSEERDDDAPASPSRFPPSRNESFSDNESEAERCSSTPRRDADRTYSPSPLFTPLFDLSDTECRVTKRTTHQPRRYWKRPLRGPYGQMLEAEMKKPDLKNKKRNDDLKFLEEYLPMPEPERPSSESRLSSPRPRTSTGRSLDDSHLRTSYIENSKSSPKRKISANIPYSSQPEKIDPSICHQRTTSSPSQLGTYSSNEANKCIAPSEELLAELLKGSSERPYLRDVKVNNCLKDERSHVVSELVEHEGSYVESLRTIVKRYLNPLKSAENEDLVDAAIVDEIFYQIPEILSHHERLYEDLKERLDSWSPTQKVGDILLDVFTKQSVIETYMLYICNREKAKEAFDICKQKPNFQKFLASTSCYNKGKLKLNDLFIQPVQKIPHYELLIQRLLKNTDVNHSDHALLLAAQREIHELAVKIDATLTENFELEQQQRTLRDLESLIDGLADLPACDRIFLRTDTVTMVTGQGARKERALFLFSDLLLITSVKRRAGPIKKPGPTCTGLPAGTVDTNKYKLLRRLPLDDLEIIKTKDERVRSILREVERLSEDAATLSHICELASGLHSSHAAVDEAVKDLLSQVNRQLQERQTGEAQQACLEVILGTQNEGENISMIFTSTDKRTTWEETFVEAKQKLALNSEHRPCPEFVAPVPIQKTRAGLQFTCASPALAMNPSNLKVVWVCNSDGYVGQVCVLSLTPEPNVISCNGVCNARILCIASVPSLPSSESDLSRTSGSFEPALREGSGEDGGSSDIDADSSSSSSPSDDDDPPEGEVNMRRSKSEPLTAELCDDGDVQQPAMWLGTEDGNIHVYSCSDNIRVKKNKVKIQHGSSVQCIIYYDSRVFVALANGDVTVYSRDKNGCWNTSEPESIAVGTAAASVTKMIPVGGRLWCGCHNMIRIINIVNLEVEKSFPASPDSSRMVSGLAVSNLGVWIALHNSAVLRLFHATTFDCLCEVNVAPAVTKMLAGCDDIIRQHKAACLRVTSLLACKDLLWVGTSAGVVLTLPLPHVTSSTTKLNSVPNVTGVPQGHTGHVRFLTAVETSPPSHEPPLRPVRHRHSLKSKMEQSQSNSSKVLVISGGDGYEDFRNGNSSELAGREDSTNHLLLWQT